ncbi:hypothetical protein GCM10010393_05910 [Streptomyces gobitricini]|uniref:Uncharacterized protein n=1 Tax=Streptomyces gobitricini TaxID=68211 RepID=A0ABP5YFB0_9ACTN
MPARSPPRAGSRRRLSGSGGGSRLRASPVDGPLAGQDGRGRRVTPLPLVLRALAGTGKPFTRPAPRRGRRGAGAPDRPAAARGRQDPRARLPGRLATQTRIVSGYQ